MHSFSSTRSDANSTLETQVRKADERLFCSTRQEQADKTFYWSKGISGPVERQETGGVYQLPVD
mgnify:CR=1 FL=1